LGNQWLIVDTISETQPKQTELKKLWKWKYIRHNSKMRTHWRASQNIIFT